MAKASRKLLLALLTNAVCLALLAAGTYALFSREFPITNHLVAGNLNITLTRTGLETTTLGASGHLVTTTDPNEKDFTNADGENIFELKDGAVIAPGCKFTAQLKLTNAGTVAFSYWLEVVVTDSSQGEALAQQLKVKLTTESGESQDGSVSTGFSIGSETDGIGVVDVDKSAQFSVSVEFPDLENNNDARDQSVKFDIVIHAIQATTP